MRQHWRERRDLGLVSRSVFWLGTSFCPLILCFVSCSPIKFQSIQPKTEWKKGCWGCVFDVLRKGCSCFIAVLWCPSHSRALGPGMPKGIIIIIIITLWHLVNFVISCQRLNSAIIYDRDFSYNYFGFKVKGTVPWLCWERWECLWDPLDWGTGGVG